MTKHVWTLAAAAVFATTSMGAVQAKQGSAMGANTSGVVSTDANYSHSMDELTRAAQRLRESIQAIAQQPRGQARDQALMAAREALWDTQQAMVQMPPRMRQANSGDDPASMRQLERASERLYSAIHNMAKAPAGDRRNAAIRQANEALFETEHAIAWMIDAPPARADRATWRTRTASSAGSSYQAQGVAATQAGGSVGGGITAGSDASAVGSAAAAVAGGVGLNARAQLANEAMPDHNVKMVFSLNTGNYVADVHVVVKDRAGRTVIDGTADGPWLYAKLPTGSYTATATYRGHSVTERFKVGSKGQRTAHFRWPASIEQQAVAGSAPILGTGPQNMR